MTDGSIINGSVWNFTSPKPSSDPITPVLPPCSSNGSTPLFPNKTVVSYGSKSEFLYSFGYIYFVYILFGWYLT